eukprot:10688342-Ditylum_brightwellii.AAC.1
MHQEAVIVGKNSIKEILVCLAQHGIDVNIFSELDKIQLQRAVLVLGKEKLAEKHVKGYSMTGEH